MFHCIRKFFSPITAYGEEDFAVPRRRPAKHSARQARIRALREQLHNEKSEPSKPTRTKADKPPTKCASNAHDVPNGHEPCYSTESSPIHSDPIPLPTNNNHSNVNFNTLNCSKRHCSSDSSSTNRGQPTTSPLPTRRCPSPQRSSTSSVTARRTNRTNNSGATCTTTPTVRSTSGRPVALGRRHSNKENWPKGEHVPSAHVSRSNSSVSTHKQSDSGDLGMSQTVLSYRAKADARKCFADQPDAPSKPSKETRRKTPKRANSFKEGVTSKNESAVNLVKYLLDGHLSNKQKPDVICGKTCYDLPSKDIHSLSSQVVAACTGPDNGLSEISVTKQQTSPTAVLKHLQVDFIDDEDAAVNTPSPVQETISRSSPVEQNGGHNSSSGRANVYSFANAQLPQIRQRNKADIRSLNSESSQPTSLTQTTRNVAPSHLAQVDSDLDESSTTCSSEESSIHCDSVSSHLHSSATLPLDTCEPVIVGVSDWQQMRPFAYGMSSSLYERHPHNSRRAGDPVADCYGCVVRGNSAILALADGVNWGMPARLAATCAVHGAIKYLNSALFTTNVPEQEGFGGAGTAPLSTGCRTTIDLFIALLRAFSAAHELILKENGNLTTLTVAVVAQLLNSGKFIACTCNVGDSLAYVYSKKNGVREITQGSHDIFSMRDMRDALGALGPVDGENPELSNLTVAMTVVERGDIVFLTSDGISDNFDPVVGKFALAQRSVEAVSNERAMEANEDKPKGNLLQQLLGKASAMSASSATRSKHTDLALTNTHKTRSSNLRRSNSNPDRQANHHAVGVLPSVTAEQRHQLSLARMEDLLRHGFQPADVAGASTNEARQTLQRLCGSCESAQELCERLFQFVNGLTEAKRKVLEDESLYDFDDPDHFTAAEQKKRRRRAGAKLCLLPGKLDHATVVAYQVDFYGSDASKQRTTKRAENADNLNLTLKATLAKMSLEDL